MIYVTIASLIFNLKRHNKSVSAQSEGKYDRAPHTRTIMPTVRRGKMEKVLFSVIILMSNVLLKAQEVDDATEVANIHRITIIPNILNLIG